MTKWFSLHARNFLARGSEGPETAEVEGGHAALILQLLSGLEQHLGQLRNDQLSSAEDVTHGTTGSLYSLSLT